MARITIKIDSILDGISPSWHLGTQSQYLTGLSIDPERPLASKRKAAASIHPINFGERSGSAIDSAPMWFITNPKNAKLYAYLANGKFVSYDDITFVTETSIGTPTSGAGNGAIYYNDYIYLFTPTDVSRYGPLSGSPAIVNTYWTSTLSLTALTNTSYPSSRNVALPNHAPHLHIDNKVYFCDFISGQGKIHYIKTNSTGTNDGSTYGALDLPFGYMPTDIESFGNDLAIIATPAGSWSSGSVFKPGESALFLWDTFSSSFYRQVALKDAIGSALLNKNGELFAWSGSYETGVRVGRYLGGDSIQPLVALQEGMPPCAGAVDTLGNMVAWGGYVTYPTAAAGVFALGYRNAQLPGSALNHIARISDTTNADPIVSAIKFCQPGTTSSQYPIIGWRTGTTASYGIDVINGADAHKAIWRSGVFNIGQKFVVKQVRIPMSVAVASTTSIVPTIYVDDETTSTALTTINNTNFPSARVVNINPTATGGEYNFYLELAFNSTAEGYAANLPITIVIETLNDL